MRGVLALMIVLLAGHPAQEQLKLEIRTYRGTEDVSAATRVIVHRAGQREKPVGQISPGNKRTIGVIPGVYDAQAIHENRRSINRASPDWGNTTVNTRARKRMPASDTRIGSASLSTTTFCEGAMASVAL